MSVIKKKRVSKRNKSAWRKYSKVQDVEEFLEDQRVEERHAPSNATNEECFELDCKRVERKFIKETRDILKNKPLKCFKMLQPLTSVLDPVIKRNRCRSKEERKSVLVKEAERRRKELGIFKKRDMQSSRDRKKFEEKRANMSEQKEFNMDVWGREEKNEVCKLEWVNNKVKSHILQAKGQQKKRIPKLIQNKVTQLPATEEPHPGMSYNPSLQDHCDLLEKVVEKERAIMKKDEHLNRVTSQMFRKVTRQEKDESDLRELLEGAIVKYEDESGNSDGELKNINPPVRCKKKTLKQRRKHREHNLTVALINKAKKERKKLADLNRLRVLKDNVEHEQKRQMELKAKKEKRFESKKNDVKKLGPGKFEESEIDFNMPEDISGNLRNIKKEGNLLVDHFKSLQRRNILRPTVKHGTLHKAKTKKFEKNDFKNNWKVTVARSNDNAL